MDIQKQISYWHDSADEDWEVGVSLVNQGKARHGLFFVHLALEKLLKAHVCRATNDFAPRIHALLRLVELSGLTITDAQQDFLARFDQYNIAGRYPCTLGPLPSKHETQRDMQEAQEVYAWLKIRL